MTKIAQRENCHKKYLLLRRWILSQRTFIGHEDVLKMSSKHLLKTTSSTRLERNNFSSSKTKNFFIFKSSFFLHFQCLAPNRYMCLYLSLGSMEARTIYNELAFTMIYYYALTIVMLAVYPFGKFL